MHLHEMTYSQRIQAYLRNFVSLDLDQHKKNEYHNKESLAFFGFSVNIKVMFTLYCGVLNVQ